jgi:threonine-phosphate decarboxylase
MRQICRQRPRLTWLCVPNNPTGVDVTTEDIIALAEACAAHNGLLVLDRTYHAFVRGRETWTDQWKEII